MDIERVDYYRDKLELLRETSMMSMVVELMDKLLSEIDNEWNDFMNNNDK
jgi:hypothetical protein